MADVTWERTAPAAAETISGLRREVAAAAGEAGASDQERADIALAVSEALGNVVRHAYVDQPEPGPMRVAVAAEPGTFTVEVSDEGGGMRPRVGSEGAGLGLAMISALTSELTMSAGDTGRGTKVAMRFALTGGSA